MEERSRLRFGMLGADSPPVFEGAESADGEVDIVAFARLAGFEPDVHQMAVLQSTAKQGILNCTRQWGKSTTAAAMAAYRVVMRPGSMVVVAAPTEKQSAELVKKAAGMIAVYGLGSGGIRIRKDGIHKVSLALENGSRMVGLPGNEATVRGLSAVNLLLVDEASRVRDALYQALRPMLTVPQGDVWLMSTPWATHGFFYEAWANGGRDWERISVKATECPRISREWLEREWREIGDVAFRRDYMAEFVQDEASAFDAEVVREALDKGVTPLALGLMEFRRRSQERRCSP